jgi:protein required for attachment to host cells
VLIKHNKLSIVFMQIPSSLPSFSSPTLIAVTDSHQAILWLGTDRIFEKVKEWQQDESLDKDTERYAMYLPDGTRSGEWNERAATVAREKFYHELSALLKKECETRAIRSLIVCVPEEHENELKEILHGSLLKLVHVWIPKNLVHEAPLDILEYIAQE